MDRRIEYFESNYTNDTSVEFINAGSYLMLVCSFVSEDPDDDVNIIKFQASPKTMWSVLVENSYDMIRQYLNATDGGIRRHDTAPFADMFDEYSNSTLYAIEGALREIITKTDVCGSMTIKEASVFVALQLNKYAASKFSFCESSKEEAMTHKKPDDGGWHGICRLTNLFDNDKEEFIVVAGHHGGGNIGLGYADYDSSIDERISAVSKAIISANRDCDWDENTYIYIEEEK